jgi:hypothetical protein
VRAMVVLVAALLFATAARAAEAGAPSGGADEATKLAKQTQNPVANLISVPFQNDFGKVGLPVNTQLQAFYNAEKPEFGPDWQLRFQLQFLFPR